MSIYSPSIILASQILLLRVMVRCNAILVRMSTCSLEPAFYITVMGDGRRVELDRRFQFWADG